MYVLPTVCTRCALCWSEGREFLQWHLHCGSSLTARTYYFIFTIESTWIGFASLQRFFMRKGR